MPSSLPLSAAPVRRLPSGPARAVRLFAPLAVLACLLFIRKEFGAVTFEQFIFHVHLGVRGAVTVDPVLLRRFFLCLGAALVMALGLTALSREAPRARLRWPARVLRAWLTGWRYVLVLAATLTLAAWQTGFAAYARHRAAQDFYAGHFVDPKSVAVVPRHPRNLLLIYVESLEQAYTRADLFGRNLVEELDPAVHGGLSFDFVQMPGAHFTIGGMVGTMCGIPLNAIGLFQGNQPGNNLRAFLPGARCLGDILAGAGYRNVYLNGANLEFSGLRTFVRTHGYQLALGREDWLERGYTLEDMNGWGLYDDDLIKESIIMLDTLMADGGPFNLTVSTMDTHNPGYMGPLCRAAGLPDDFSGVVRCTSRAVDKLLRHVRDRGWEDEIAVVVMGDHLVMRNDLSPQLDQAGTRTVFNRFLLPGAPRPTRDTITHFDLMPTLLTIAGFDVPGGRLGFGYGALAPDDAPYPPRWLDNLRDNVLNYSEFYNRLWLPEERALRGASS